MKKSKVRLVLRLKDCRPPLEVLPKKPIYDYKRSAGSGDFVDLEEGYALQDISSLKNDPNRVRKYKLDQDVYDIVEEAGIKLVIFKNIIKKDAESIVLKSLRHFVCGDLKINELKLGSR